MEGLKTNTHKKHYHIAITLDGKLIDTFGAHTDSVVNALKSAYEQCCGYTFTPREPLPEPPKSVQEIMIEDSGKKPKEEPKKRGRKPKEKVEPTPPPIPEPKKRGRKPKNANG